MSQARTLALPLARQTVLTAKAVGVSSGSESTPNEPWKTNDGAAEWKTNDGAESWLTYDPEG